MATRTRIRRVPVSASAAHILADRPSKKTRAELKVRAINWDSLAAELAANDLDPVLEIARLMRKARRGEVQLPAALQVQVYLDLVKKVYPNRQHTTVDGALEIKNLTDDELDDRIAHLASQAGIGGSLGGESEAQGREQATDLLPV